MGAHTTSDDPTRYRTTAEGEAWNSLFALRALAFPALEKARQAKHIGKALEAVESFEYSKLAQFIDAAGGKKQAASTLATLKQRSHKLNGA
mgnify:CR=1 FL=1